MLAHFSCVWGFREIFGLAAKSCGFRALGDKFRSTASSSFFPVIFPPFSSGCWNQCAQIRYVTVAKTITNHRHAMQDPEKYRFHAKEGEQNKAQGKPSNDLERLWERIERCGSWWWLSLALTPLPSPTLIVERWDCSPGYRRVGHETQTEPGNELRHSRSTARPLALQKQLCWMQAGLSVKSSFY